MPAKTLPRLLNTALALCNLKLIVSWDRTSRRALLQPARWWDDLLQRVMVRPPHFVPYRVVRGWSWTVELSLGRGAGYLQEWWTNLNRGPGKADGHGEKDYGKGRCGHPWPYHCNNAYCGNPWCLAQRWPIFGALFVCGLSLSLSWFAKHQSSSGRRVGVRNGLRLSFRNGGNGPYPDGGGTWKARTFYGRKDQANPPYVLAASQAGA